MKKNRQFERLPVPLNKDKFRLLTKGISDRRDIDVWVNENFDYACLDPVPEVEYKNYQSRVKKFNLAKYKNKGAYYVRRLEKIKKHIVDSETILEVGASNGQFLECVQKEFPLKKLFAIEPDFETLNERQQRRLVSYSDIKDFLELNKKVDIVSMFHVFEHILDPVSMLMDASEALKPDGKLILEVPALTDPLLSLYEIPEFVDFYFQAQHPYIYSASSLKKVLLSNGFKIFETIPFQRYGLENHLSWLKNRRPGGDPDIADVVGGLDQQYRENLEKKGATDSVIIIAGLS
jgi:2-polyprenyl-3-methyl-5-hydroxy-6-metoxy-1,4-benzoquinol methylase